MKIYNEDLNVYDASLERIIYSLEEFENNCISLSGGKDSSVMFQLICREAQRLNKKIDVLFIDMEAQYLITIEHINELIEKYSDVVENFWHICLPLSLRNAVSIFEPRWICWDEKVEEKWIRELPVNSNNINNNIFEFYNYGMEFEEFVPEFEKWYEDSRNGKCAHYVGIRSDESLNRWRTIASTKKTTYNNLQWTTFNKSTERSYSIYPIYDYKTQDIWTCVAKEDLLYNYVYELMYKNGVSIHEQRLCQPYGDDQKNGLDQYKSIEHHNWEKLLKRVSGVNFGNIYCRTSALGNIKSEKPEHLTWQEWACFLLESIGIYNEDLMKHYAVKIRNFIKYWEEKGGCPLEQIPDEADKKMESLKVVPSWRRIARALERNDFFMSRLSFTQTKSDIIYLESMISKYNNVLDVENTDSKPLKREFLKLKGEENE